MFRKLLAIFAVTAMTSIAFVPSAGAVIQNYQESAFDTYTPPGTPSNFDAVSVSYAEFSESPEFHYFYIDFAAPLRGGQFNDGLGSWAMIGIDVNGDNAEDYRIETSQATLVQNFNEPAYLYDIRNNREVEDCSVVFFGDLDASARWVGFSLPYNCLKLPRSFGIQGYSDYIADDNFAYDYVPEETFFRVTHNLASPSVVTSLAQPALMSESLYAVGNPGAAPADLVALSPAVLKSVVTVFCNQGLGTGWAAKVSIPSSVTQQGMKSFVVTNYHVIEECLGVGEVTLTDNSGNSAIGYIASADADRDLAGIYTKMSLPTLSFRGERPAQGWWVGVLGSPRGLDGYLTTGLVSKVATDGSEFGVSASLNPGNSGGPIFDRLGRVLGVATYKILDSEGLGFARSATLLCFKVVQCDSALPVWSTQLAAGPADGSGGSSATPQVKTITLPSFAAGSSRLTSTQQNSINRVLILNGWAKKFICTGVVATNATASQKLLARTRAKVACEFGRKQNPNLSTFYQTKTSTSRTAIGKVLVTIKN